MRPTPLLATAAAAALLAATAGPAAAATAPVVPTGVGQALSAGSLVQLRAAGQALEALRLQLPTTTEGTAGALVKVTPLLRDGAAVVPAVEVAAGETRELPSQTAGIPGILDLVSPSGTLKAVVGDGGPVSTLTTGAGDLRLLGVDLLGDGALDVTSAVTTTGATGTKSLTLDGVTLPSLAELLSAVGVDLGALPAETVVDLLDVLDLVSTDVVTTLTDLIPVLDVTTVTELVTVLTDRLVGVLPELTELEVQQVLDVLGATTEEVAAVTDLQTAVGGLTDALGGLTGSPTAFAAARGSLIGDAVTVPVVPLLPSPELPVEIGEVVGEIVDVDAVTGVITVPVLEPVLELVEDVDAVTTITDLVEDLQAVTTLEELVTVVEDLVTELVTTVTDLVTSLLTPVLDALPVGADLTALLDTPLLQVGAMEVSTLARSGADEAADVTGTVEGLEVLGTDVLDTLLGSSSVDVAALLADDGAVLGQVQGVVDGLIGEVTGVLDDVVGLNVPLPEVSVLSVVEEVTAGSGSTRTARAGVEALTIEWALSELTVPAALSDVVGGVTGGLPLGAVGTLALPTDALLALVSEDLSLVVGDLTDTSAFTVTAAGAVPPAVTPGTGTPTTGTPTTGNPGTLPTTGASSALAALGVVLLVGAAVARRRSAAETA